MTIKDLLEEAYTLGADIVHEDWILSEAYEKLIDSPKPKYKDFDEWWRYYGAKTLYEITSNCTTDACEPLRTDPIVTAVTDKFKQRSAVGIKKYGTTLAENNTDDFIVHTQQELMDAILYLEKLQTQNHEK